MLTELGDEVPIVLEVGTVFSLLCNVLRTPKVDIYSIAKWFDDSCRSQQLVGVVGAELDNEGPIERWITFFTAGNIEVIIAVSFIRLGCEHLSPDRQFVGYNNES